MNGTARYINTMRLKLALSNADNISLTKALNEAKYQIKQLMQETEEAQEHL